MVERSNLLSPYHLSPPKAQTVVGIGLEAAMIIDLIRDHAQNEAQFGRIIEMSLLSKKGTVEAAICYLAGILVMQASNPQVAARLAHKLMEHRELYRISGVPINALEDAINAVSELPIEP